MLVLGGGIMLAQILNGGFMQPETENHIAYSVTRYNLNMNMVLGAFLFVVGLIGAIGVHPLVRSQPGGRTSATPPVPSAAGDDDQWPRTEAAHATASPGLPKQETELSTQPAYYTPQKSSTQVLQGLIGIFIGLPVFAYSVFALMFNLEYVRGIPWTGDSGGLVEYILGAIGGFFLMITGANRLSSKPKPRQLIERPGAKIARATKSMINSLLIMLVIAAILGVMVVTVPSKQAHEEALYAAMHETAGQQGGLNSILGNLSVTVVEASGMVDFEYNNHILYSTLSYNGTILSYGIFGQVIVGH
jgi:hypothetical protein